MAEVIELACPNCGAKVETDRAAAEAQCAHCGTELVIERKAMPVAPAVEPDKCPKCGRADRVQKVSSVYKEGFRTGYHDGWRGSQTELSKSLRPPSEPLLGATRGPIETFMTGCGYVFLSVLGPGLLLVGLLVGLSNPNNAWFNILSIVGLGFTVLLVLSILRDHTDWLGPSNMYQRSAKRKSWEKAINRWERLYYCARDDGVFIPGETSFIPIDKMQEFLYAD